ncbi:MAG: hypothetical protein WCD79_13910 [Chthoniobacteraceae bacterium]
MHVAKIAHGNQDALISMERGRRLYDAFPGAKKKWIEVEGGTHGTILVTPMALYAEMSAWFLAAMKQGNGSRGDAETRRRETVCNAF